MAKQSLFAQQQKQTEQQSDLLMLPAPQGISQVEAPERETYSSYVKFMYVDKGKWGEVRQQVPGLADGDAVLFGAGEPRKVAPFVFFLLDLHQYWCTRDAVTFKAKRAWLKKPEDRAIGGDRVCEVLSAALVLQLGGELIPATVRFNDAMAAGVYTSKDAVAEAAAPGWATKSSDHAVTMQIPMSHLRFKTELTWRVKKARSGRNYYVSSARILPITLGDAAAFKEIDREALNLMVQSFREHKQEIEQLAK